MSDPVSRAYASGKLTVTSPHVLAWTQAGDPDGVPILFLHGGPGGRARPAARGLCASAQWRIVQFDQRGCGASTPAAEIQANTTQDSVDDIEALRRHLGIERWVLFGHSWGSALALSYGQRHPQRCLGLVVSAIYLGGRAEARWFFEGPRAIFPEAWEAMTAALAPADRADPLAALRRMIESGDADTRMKAARAIHAYDSWLSPFMPDAAPRPPFDAEASYCYARIFLHYAANDFFLGDDTLIDGAATLHGLPVEIVQGRYDLGVSMRPALRLAQALPTARFTIVADGSHSAAGAGMRRALSAAMTRTFTRITTGNSIHGKG